MASEIEKLPQSYAEVWDIFKEIQNKQDREAYERFLAAEDIRYKFYEKLSVFARLLKLALSNLDWCNKTELQDQITFKEDLKFFLDLRISVKRRYADSLDFKEYESQVRKLIDKHLSTNGDVILVTPQVNIFDIDARQTEVDKLKSPAAKADHIASSTQKTISLNADADPAFAKRMSQLIQQAIDDYHADRISEADYLKRAQELQQQYINGGKNEVPASISTPFKLGIYHLINSVFESDKALSGNIKPETIAEIVLGINNVGLSIITDGTQPIVDWKQNPNIHRALKQEIDDYLFIELNTKEINLLMSQIDTIIDDAIQLFKHHFNG
jgi:type I restriction enzyme R subunit